jgi:hypothetical protein
VGSAELGEMVEDHSALSPFEFAASAVLSGGVSFGSAPASVELSSARC